MSARFKVAREPKTWGEWLAKPDTLATRQDIVNYVAMQDDAWGVRIAQLIVADRPWNRFTRWLKGLFRRHG